MPSSGTPTLTLILTLILTPDPNPDPKPDPNPGPGPGPGPGPNPDHNPSPGPNPALLEPLRRAHASLGSTCMHAYTYMFSGAYASLKNASSALSDADECIKLAPNWAKVAYACTYTCTLRLACICACTRLGKGDQIWAQPRALAQPPHSRKPPCTLYPVPSAHESSARTPRCEGLRSEGCRSHLERQV